MSLNEKERFEVPEEELEKVSGGGEFTYLCAGVDEKDAVFDIEANQQNEVGEIKHPLG